MIIYETITKEMKDLKLVIEKQDEILKQILKLLKQKEKDNETI